MSTVSAIVPAFNVAPFLGQTLESVIAQTHPGLDIIVVDDGSSDGTAAVAESMIGRAARRGHTLRVFRQDNRGCGGARNTGLAHATGDYIAFIDGDDLWEPEMAARHAAELDRNPGLDVSFCWTRIVEESGEWTGRIGKPAVARPRFADLVLKNNVIGMSTMLVRRSAIEAAGGFDPALVAVEDLDLWLRIACLRDGNIACLPELLSVYRLRKGQMTKDWRRMQRGWLAVMAKAAALRPREYAALERQARARAMRYWAWLAYRAGEYAAARSLLARAWARSPGALVVERRTWPITLGIIVESTLPNGIHNRIAEGWWAVQARLGRARYPVKIR